MPTELVQFITNASSPVAVAALVLWFWQKDAKARDEMLIEQKQQEREDKLLMIKTLQDVVMTQSRLESAINRWLNRTGAGDDGDKAR